LQDQRGAIELEINSSTAPRGWWPPAASWGSAAHSRCRFAGALRRAALGRQLGGALGAEVGASGGRSPQRRTLAGGGGASPGCVLGRACSAATPPSLRPCLTRSGAPRRFGSRPLNCNRALCGD